MRMSWERTFLNVASIMSYRATCTRQQCGAVVVSEDEQILASGYNGAPRGQDHCINHGCIIEGGHCVRAIHAEANALLQGARHGIALRGATLYATHRPCVRCAGQIIQAGIVSVIYANDYDTDTSVDYVAKMFLNSGVLFKQSEAIS